MHLGQALFLLLGLWIWMAWMLEVSSSDGSQQFMADDEHAERRKLATDRPGFISIDCGAPEDYLDQTTGIYYKSDAAFISAGANNDISPEYVKDDPYTGRLLSNLRSFPEGIKNCYSLKPEQGKNINYLIRAFFKYGNYDRQNRIPKFDLYLGVNYWETVEMSDNAEWSYYDIIHYSLTDTIHICLVNTSDGVPFISGLELRLLNDSIYRTDSGALRCFRRQDLGSSANAFVRFKYDVYDRIWHQTNLPQADSISTTSNIGIWGSNDTYRLPEEVFQTASQSQNGSSSLKYNHSYSLPGSPRNEVHLYLYFAETAVAAKTRRRKFSITFNGDKYGPITLEYLQSRTIVLTKSQDTESVDLSIDATSDSELPPILNGFEIYASQALPNSPTDAADANAMIDIMQKYKISRDGWQGDPCVPRGFLWTGLKCISDSSPRIISLNLSSSKLEGEIASSFFSLKALESLDLSNNELTGTVPEFLAKLSNLTFLNLSGNKLTGPIPLTLREKSNKGTLQLSLDENLKSCLANPCEEKKKKKKKRQIVLPVVACAISALVLLVILSVLIIIYRNKRRQEDSEEEWPFKSKNGAFTYSDIVRITANFRTVIGEGGFGKVYLGTLDDNTQVAVKVLSSSSKQGYKEFRAEAQLLMIVHHKNMVSLVGYCDEGGHMALIYEYMANGNLRHQLSDIKANTLDWNQRLQIAIDAAHGLEYLHNGCKPSIVHRDLKTSNILLTENMQAKIADFGLSRAFSTESATHISTCAAGTPGYLGPEFHSTGNINKKSDVYSFGIVLLELITSQPAIIRADDYSNHITQVVSAAIEGGDIRNIVDPKLQGAFDINAAWKAVEIAMSCVEASAIQRPDMGVVLAELKECWAIEMASGRTQRSMSEVTSSSSLVEITTPMPR